MTTGRTTRVMLTLVWWGLVSVGVSAQTTTVGGSGRTTVTASGTARTVVSLPKWLMIFGDSKSAINFATTTWPCPFALAVEAETGYVWGLNDQAVSGRTVNTTLAAMSAMLAASPDAPGAAEIRVLVNLGANDFAAMPAIATWESEYGQILDAIHAKWPTARVYVALAWRQNQDANANTAAASIATLVAARSSWASLGHDERVWMKGSDNGATMSYDGTHYSTAGNTEIVNQWIAVLFP